MELIFSHRTIEERAIIRSLNKEFNQEISILV